MLFMETIVVELSVGCEKTSAMRRISLWKYIIVHIIRVVCCIQALLNILFKRFHPCWMSNPLSDWESKLSCFPSCIPAWGGCMLCSGCPDTAGAAVSQQGSRGTPAELVHLSCTWSSSSLSAVGSGQQTHHTDRRRCSRFRSTCWPSSCSSSRWESCDFVLTLFPYWFLWETLLLGFQWHILTSMYWDSLSQTDRWMTDVIQMSFICIAFLLCFLFPTLLPAVF